MKSLRRIGSVAGGARRAQVVERAAEVRALGEDRQRRRAAALVGADDRRSTVAPSRISPADGERRLCSAITETPGRASASRERAVLARGRSRRALELARAAPRAAPAPTSSRVALDDAVEDVHAAPASSLPICAA